MVRKEHARTCARVFARTRPAHSRINTAEGIIKSVKPAKNGYLRLFVRKRREKRALCARFCQFSLNTAEGIIKSDRTARCDKHALLARVYLRFGLLSGRSGENGQKSLAWSGIPDELSSSGNSPN